MRKQISIIARPIWHTRAMYQTSDRTEAEARHSRRYIRENAVNYTTRKIKTCPISHQGLRLRITARHFLIGESFLCHHDLICRWFADLQSCVPLPESSLTTTINYTRISTREKAYVRTTFTHTHTYLHTFSYTDTTIDNWEHNRNLIIFKLKNEPNNASHVISTLSLANHSFTSHYGYISHHTYTNIQSQSIHTETISLHLHIHTYILYSIIHSMHRI